MKALVVAGGQAAPPQDQAAAFASRLDDDVLVIAADGGLLNARALGLAVDLVVGDGDSLPPSTIEQLAADGIEFERHPIEKEASDTELAVRAALARGAGSVLVLGALGGLRFDHALANVLLLADAAMAATPVVIADGGTTIRALDGELAGDVQLAGVAGDVVSLLPLSREVSGVTLSGLRYPLAGATLRRGSTLGLSNVMTGNQASVHVDAGCLLVVHVGQAPAP